MSATTHKDPPHVEIEVAAAAVMNIASRQVRYLRSKSTEYIQDLLQATRDVAHHTDSSVRVGAELNRAAALLVLEERGLK